MMNVILSKRFDEISKTHRQITELIPIIYSSTVDCRPDNLLWPLLPELSSDILNHYASSIETKTLKDLVKTVEWDNLCIDHPKRQANEANGFIGLHRNIPFYYTNITKYAIEEFIKDTEKQILETEKNIKQERQLQEAREKEMLIKERERAEREHARIQERRKKEIEESMTHVFEGSLEYNVYMSTLKSLQNAKPTLSPFFTQNISDQKKDFDQKEAQKIRHIAEWKDRLAIVRNGMDEALALIQAEKERFEKEQQELVNTFQNAVYLYQWKDVTSLFSLILDKSEYPFDFKRNIELEYTKDRNLIIHYQLPSFEDVQKIDTGYPITKSRMAYEDIIYSITIRSMAEVFHFDELKHITSICFNGIVTVRNKCTGKLEDRIILSLNATRGQIETLDLEYISPKECFKFQKGVSASKLYDSVPIVPIQTISFSDKRIVESRKIETESSVNLAEMDWEEFEHLVRQIFEWEFNTEGTEVHVTQASRDGGVDAIVFDPDPIRGGKIVIQAKRYTNTVGVSAVRDLYGTVINEGANKGILITTSDYGSDSYNFAKGKPLTLLNGAHLLYLLEKHGKNARIDIGEAKDKHRRNANKN